MASSSPSTVGRPVQLLQLVEGSEEAEDSACRFRLNMDIANEIEDFPRLLNAKVAIISVAGAFRKGKSFLLNFLLRYLRAVRSGNSNDWIRSTDDLSDGFHWRSGSQRDTTGILVWSEPFFIRNASGEEVAVLLMDTQGTFDHQSSSSDCTTVFAMSTLLSSVQIFNIAQNIQETDLQHLRLFVEFASMASSSKEKVLQHLWFLVRDWQCPSEFGYGTKGGEMYLTKVLSGDDKQSHENQQLRQGIRQHFESASCCLLPHPGGVVADFKFSGGIRKLNKQFVLQLERFIPQVFAPSMVAPKKVNGMEITGRELVDLLPVYFEAFCTGKMPSPQNVFTATVQMANICAAAEAKHFFETKCQDFMGGDVTDSQELDKFPTDLVDQSLALFDAMCMEKDSRDSQSARQRLQTDLEELSSKQMTLKKLVSDQMNATAEAEILKKEIEVLQKKSSDGEERLQRLETDFNKRVEEIRASSISKDVMERRLREETARLSERTMELRSEIRELQAASKANESEISGKLYRSQDDKANLERENRRLQEKLCKSEQKRDDAADQMAEILASMKAEKGFSDKRIREIEQKMQARGCFVM